MLKNTFIILFILFTLSFQAQDENTSLKIYRGEKTKDFDLIHTRLNVSFDFSKREMKGEAWIRIKPHFYSAQKITLDAKAMLIHEVKMANTKLDYNYDGNSIIIDLNKPFDRNENFELYIKYTARPELVEQKGSASISGAKGLYFIDPDGTDPDKPTQIWTQGETESSSCWFPTIDSPNQKTTQEIAITVDNKYTTLSNGVLVEQISRENGMRTDIWKMDLPHAPYLFFMGIGAYAIVEDKWNDIPVNYYVEPAYESVAKDIFGNTPEMIQFFSDIFGMDFPWQKYSQMVGRDFVSGAMENTTSTLHAEDAQQKKGNLIDENRWEDVISHELSHHWFGDYVTTESWSNLTVNESFATYAEYLWRAYKYGKDHADAHLYDDKQTYFSGGNELKDLVRFHYAEREDMFDGVSYQKGGIVLHMLRQELGDEAFFAGLSHYLKQHQFGTAEAHQLRISLEQVSGKDLNPFFNQWYYANGHPKLFVYYQYNDALHTVSVTIKQGDQVFHFPLKIDVYESGKRIEHTVQMSQREQTFTFQYNEKPKLININADHVLLCEITDKEKTLEQFIFQYLHAPHFEDRLEAISVLLKNQNDDTSFKTLIKALDDPYYELRIKVLQNIDLSKKYRKEAIGVIEKIATQDPKTKVQAEAMGVLAKLLDIKYKPLFMRGMLNDSYSIKSNATMGLYYLDKPRALEGLKTFSEETKQDLATLLIQIYITENDESQMPFIANNLLSMMFSNNATEKQQKDFMNAFQWIGSSNNEKAIQNLTNDLVSKGKRYKQYGIDQIALNMMQQVILFQNKAKNSQKDALILIVKKGIAKLVD